MLISMKKFLKNRKISLIFNTLIKRKCTSKNCNLLLSIIQASSFTIVKKKQIEFFDQLTINKINFTITVQFDFFFVFLNMTFTSIHLFMINFFCLINCFRTLRI